MSWLKRKLFKKKISIAVIGVGNAGCKIGENLIRHLNECKITVKSLAVNIVDDFEPKIHNFSDTFWFGDEKFVSSDSEFEKAYKQLKAKEKRIKDKLERVAFFKRGDRRDEDDLALHLIIGSGGGTGSAGTIITSRLLADITGEPPTVIYVLPKKDAPSLVQFNAARALYYLGFDTVGPHCPILLFDNEKRLNVAEGETLEEVIERSNDLLAETLTTTILSALQESTHEEFYADLNDFFKSFSKDARGLGIIVSLDREFETLEKAQNTRFSDLFFNELDESSSLTTDVTRAKLGYLAITMPTTYQSTFETRKIVKKFEKGDIKVSLNSIEEPILTIRGVLTGIHPDYVERFWEVLEKGKDTRDELLEAETIIPEAEVETIIEPETETE
ncbi:MAG: Tubulin-like protein CetZ [Candidatus Heimdallarchaeota archaeon AB_125]|nr:MAG: Tubulin-like protein CetZ [Candidatus Heimdallarchaeota archaeon AB_125]